MKNIARTTKVISISLPEKIVTKMEKTRKSRGQSRSSFIAALIDKETEDARWKRIYARGQQTALDFKITSEEDIDRMLHAA